jgi:hypothetical protein
MTGRSDASSITFQPCKSCHFKKHVSLVSQSNRLVLENARAVGWRSRGGTLIGWTGSVLPLVHDSGYRIGIIFSLSPSPSNFVVADRTTMQPTQLTSFLIHHFEYQGQTPHRPSGEPGFRSDLLLG